VNAAVTEHDRAGAVEAFDADRGIGVVVDEGGEHFAFHCTAIADGTRDIAVGTRVKFAVTPGLGRWEASAVTPA
jgi:CspA family cold shock protein